MRRVFPAMGTMVSVEATVIPPGVERAFEAAESRFSLYRPETELSRVAAGSLALTDASVELRTAYADAMDWSARTGGLFSPNRPDGTIDLNGIVKARAIAAAGATLTGRWSINAGGDVLVSARERSGDETSAAAHTIGIVDPADRGALLLALDLPGSRRAVATSGSAERGDHIWRGGSAAAPDFVQVSVVADDIVTADVLATAIVAGGRAALDELTARFGVDVVTVGRAGDLLATPGIRIALARPEATADAR